MDSEKISKLIKEERKKRKLTQEELASILHVSNKTISKWETKKGTPSLDLLIPLSKFLNIELKDLLDEKTFQTYDELLIKDLKNKRQNIIKLIGGIILCLFLCFLEVIIYISGIENKYALIIFGAFIIILIIIDICSYYIYKK